LARGHGRSTLARARTLAEAAAPPPVAEVAAPGACGPGGRPPRRPGPRRATGADPARARRRCGAVGTALTGVRHDLPHDPGGLARRATDPHAHRLQRLLLRLGGAGRAGDDRAGVAHGPAGWGGEAGDVADDRLGDVVPDELRGALLRVPADLADHDDGVGVGILLERRQGVDVGGPDDRVTADADTRGEADVPQLVHHLVGQGAGLADQADPPGTGDVGRDDARVGRTG